MSRQLLVPAVCVFFATLWSLKSSAQNVCLVTASAGGQDYIVYWEPLADYTGLDSMVIYRKQGNEPSFYQIGAVKLGPTQPTQFTDDNVSTITTTKYAIAVRDDLGNIGPMSPWHQGIVMDYTGSGSFVWTAYQKEDQVDESYISIYNCMMDPSGTGGFTSMGQMPNTQLSWTDANYQSHVNGYYYIEAGLPSCEYVTKANINTSRSNIKQQISNGQAGIDEIGLQGADLQLAPNPAQETLTIHAKEYYTDAPLWISNAAGQVVHRTVFNGQELSLDIRSLEPGVYFVQIRQGDVISAKRFVKE